MNNKNMKWNQLLTTVLTASLGLEGKALKDNNLKKKKKWDLQVRLQNYSLF